MAAAAMVKVVVAKAVVARETIAARDAEDRS